MATCMLWVYEECPFNNGDEDFFYYFAVPLMSEFVISEHGFADWREYVFEGNVRLLSQSVCLESVPVTIGTGISSRHGSFWCFAERLGVSLPFLLTDDQDTVILYDGPVSVDPVLALR